MKKRNEKSTSASKKKQTGAKKEPANENVNKKQDRPVYVFPDLPLSETWFHLADLMDMFKVSRTTIDRYIRTGCLFKHKWGGTLRFNKSYVDWMIQGNRGKLSWFIAMITYADSFGIVNSLTEILG